MHVRDATVGPLLGTSAVSGSPLPHRRSRCRAHRPQSAKRWCWCPGRSRCWRPARGPCLRRSPRPRRPTPGAPRPTGEAGAVHERREPDSLLERPSRVLARETLALGRVVASVPERAIEQPGHVDRLADRLADRQRVAGRMKFRRRNSSGARPTAAATLSMCRSSAKMLCGAPKPRKAPCGGTLVATARPRTRTLGHAYGPAA